jgi:hypothetical protein
MHRLLGFAAVTLALFPASAGSAPSVEPSLRLEAQQFTVSGTCSSKTVTVASGSASSAEYGSGTFTSNVTATFDANQKLSGYTETFTATFSSAVVEGQTSRAAELGSSGSCNPQTGGFEVFGSFRTSLTSPVARAGSSDVYITTLAGQSYRNQFTPDAPPPPPPPPDNDSDGFNAVQDCNDSDPAIRPGAREIPGNAVDENCDGIVEPAPAAPLDRDGDGVPATMDCNDTNAAIRPGAAEIRGNIVDENCDGVAAPFLRLRASVRAAWQSLRRDTVVRRLDVLNLPADSTVRTTCEGRCPFRTQRRHVSRATARVGLQALFGNARLRPGTVIEIRITAPDTIGKLVRYTVRHSKLPSVRRLCLPPGGRPTAC